MKPNNIDTVMQIIAIVIILSVVFFSNTEPIPEIPIQIRAWEQCITMASEQLKIPRIQAKGYSPIDVTPTAEQDHYRVMIYSTDGFIYECDLSNRWLGNTWYLKSLSVRLAKGKG